MKKKISRIVLVLPPAVGIEGDIRIGIFKYARPLLPWSFLNIPQSSMKLGQKNAWHAAGGLGRVGRPDLAALAISYGIPFVNIYGGQPFKGLPQVGTCDRSIGEMAADHLISRGFVNFAFFGIDTRHPGFSKSRWEGYRDRLSEKGFTADCFDSEKTYPPVQAKTDDVAYDESLYRWINHLPRPVAIFACDDARGLWISDACWHLDLNVPEEVAILGVDNNPVSCTASFPPLSSIQVPGELEGFEAARLLDRLLKGEAPPAEPVLLKPKGVIARKSTNTQAVSDPRILKALAFIREHAHEKIHVNEVARKTGLCRRILENKFRCELGRTPYQEIRRTQIEMAKHMLADTDLSIESIAERTGLGNRAQMSREFAIRVGLAPAAYRRQFRTAGH